MVRSISITKVKETGTLVSFINIRILYKMILVLFFSLIILKTYSQSREIKVYPTSGITWRSTAMNFFNFKSIVPADPTKPYNYERNVQGFGINLGLQLELFNNITFEYYPSLRYDYTHHYYDLSKNRLINVINGDSIFGNDYPIDVKEFILDHNFNLIFRRKIDFGFGLTIVNAGKGYEFVNPIPRYHNIEFKTYNAFITVPIKKLINLEIKALYIPKDFPENPDEQYIMYSLRAYYKFDFLNKKK